MYLEDKIDKKILENAGFGPFDRTYELDMRNDMEPKKSHKSCTAYISHANHKVNDNEINLIVLEARRYQKDGAHTDWYVGIFEGNEPAEFTNDEQVRYFTDRIERVLHRKNRVPLKGLASSVKEVITRL